MLRDKCSSRACVDINAIPWGENRRVPSMATVLVSDATTAPIPCTLSGDIGNVLGLSHHRVEDKAASAQRQIVTHEGITPESLAIVQPWHVDQSVTL